MVNDLEIIKAETCHELVRDEALLRRERHQQLRMLYGLPDIPVTLQLPFGTTSPFQNEAAAAAASFAPPAPSQDPSGGSLPLATFVPQ